MSRARRVKKVRLSQDASPANPMSIQQRLNRARAVARSDIGTKLAAATERRTGRPRIIPVEGVLAAYVFHAMGAPHGMTIAGVCRTLKELDPAQRTHLGIPAHLTIRYKRVRSGLRAILKVVRHGVLVEHDHDLDIDLDTGEVLPCPDTCPYEAISMDAFATTLIQASLPPGYRPSNVIALDGTDIESHTRGSSKPRYDANGRAFWSSDHDARWGHRTATDRRPTEHVFGYEAHIATFAPPIAGAPLPQLSAGLAIRAGVTDRSNAAIAVLDAIGDVDEVLLDRGYTTAKAENLARPLRERGIALTMDLHANQRGTAPGPVPGTLWLDGHLYTNAIPAALRELDPPHPSMTAAEKAHLRDVFEARGAYRFIPHSAHDQEHGTQRLRGPALDGHRFRVRCPNTPASIRAEHTIPTTTCVPGTPCGCAKTVVVPDTAKERDRQRWPWQSKDWVTSFNRRSLVEGLNAQIRYQSLNVNRGFFRMTGLAATTFLLAITLIGRNLTRLHAWHTIRGVVEPWQAHLGEPIDDRPIDRMTRTRGTRRPRQD